nr:hypothetical protein [uncultured Halomonas sp.]
MAHAKRKNEDQLDFFAAGLIEDNAHPELGVVPSPEALYEEKEAIRHRLTVGNAALANLRHALKTPTVAPNGEKVDVQISHRKAPDPQVWDDKAIETLAYRLITRTLRDIRDTHFSTACRREALAWFMVDEPEWPFSLHNCCAIAGYDAVELRNQVRWIARRDGLL